LDQAVAGLLLSPAALGIYVVGTSFSNLPRILAISIGVVAYPKVAARHDQAAARRATWAFVVVTFGICGVIVAALELLVGRLLPLFFGSDFLASVPVARILLIGAFFTAGRRILSDCARGVGRPSLSGIAEVISWVTLIPAMVLFLPLLGVKGIAVALTLSAGAAFVALLALFLRTPASNAQNVISNPVRAAA
jgi:O-antigen/teichoic acid export membrane protein